jgi:serine protease
MRFLKSQYFVEVRVVRRTSLLLLTAIILPIALPSSVSAWDPSVTATYKESGNASDAINPWSPRFGHAYRRGAVPTREAHQKANEWAVINRPSSSFLKVGKAKNEYAANLKAAAATGNETLSFAGGVDGIGVTSGTPKVYLVFWGGQWGTQGTDGNGNLTFSGDPQHAAPYMQNWLKGLGTNNELWSGVMTQYCDGPLVAVGATSCPLGAPHVGYPSGGVLAGVWYDNSSASPNAATGKQIAQEAVNAAGHFGNTTAASNRYAQYIIMAPTGTQPDGFNTNNGGFCAWHDWNGDTTLSGGGAAQSAYGDIAFTNMPYVSDMGSSCGASSVKGVLDGFSIVGGHEYAETITDQNPAGGWINLTGSRYNGEENGDECAWISSGQGAAALVSMATGSFAMQSSWSNDTNRCDISHPIVTGTGGTPSANFTSTTSGLAANFSDKSTDIGGTIGSYLWNFGDNTTSSLVNPSHTYSSPGTYTVSETVTDQVSGAQSSHSGNVSVNRTGGVPTASFTYMANGLTLTFNDASTDLGGSIANYSWNFGDSTTSTTKSPTHTFTSAGTYTVKETVRDSVNGKTGTSSQTVSVSKAVNLIGNGGYEAGATASPWVTTPGVICGATCTGETPHSGLWFAWLDGYGTTHTDSVDQTIQIPSGKKSATLSFYLHIDTQEVGRIAYDRLDVQVLSSTGTLLGTLASYTNVNAATGYALKSLNMNSYIGQTIKLRFKGTEDSSLATSFVIDDAALLVQ